MDTIITLKVTQSGIDFLKTTSDNHSAINLLRNATPYVRTQSLKYEADWLIERGYVEEVDINSIT